MFAPAGSPARWLIFPPLLFAGLLPEWPLRNWIHIGVVCLTVTGINVPATRWLAPDSC
jgi:hypothetical protein